MKKLLAILLSMAMILVCFVGCGANPKKQEAIDAFNSASTVFDSVANLINENADSIDEEIITVFQEMSALLTEYKEFLEQEEETTDEGYDAIIDWLTNLPTTLNAIKEEIEMGLAALTEEVAAEQEESVFPVALGDVDAYEVPDISLTGWYFAGGLVDGVEMEEEEVNAVLAACGGVFEFIFLMDGEAVMNNGENMFEGTYEVILDNSALFLSFPGYEYYGVYTMVEDEYILILSNTSDPTSAFYFRLIEEG